MKLRIPLFIVSVFIGNVAFVLWSAIGMETFKNFIYFVPIILLTVFFELSQISEKKIPLHLGMMIIVLVFAADLFVGR